MPAEGDLLMTAADAVLTQWGTCNCRVYINVWMQDKSLTLSVSISASTSPAANSSPSLFFHEAMLPCKQHQACQPACTWTHTN